jgi:hypothetical protein
MDKENTQPPSFELVLHIGGGRKKKKERREREREREKKRKDKKGKTGMSDTFS